MSRSSTIFLPLGPRSHRIVIGDGIIASSIRSAPVLRDTRALIVCDARLRPLARRVAQALGSRHAGTAWLRGGEPTKDISTLPRLYKAASRARLDRQSTIIAIGGGVIGDVAGFFAATYLRGIRIIHIPTTLVAQVDSAIGGKTGVNLPGGKNLVGAFHQPSLVIVDPTALKTLPTREYRSGLAEVIKYGVIADAPLFRRLEKNLTLLLHRNPRELAWVIHRCCAIKARVVSRDEREITGLRAILNFGHTIGHGIESAARYKLLHGEAIALGMIAATQLSEKLSSLPRSDTQRIRTLIARAGLQVRPKKRLKPSCILAAMRLDKKSAHGQIRFVLAKRIGKVVTGIPLTDRAILDAISLVN